MNYFKSLNEIQNGAISGASSGNADFKSLNEIQNS